VSSTALKQIYCFIEGGRAFARVDVIDRSTGSLYFTDWINSAIGWINWTVEANGAAPKEADVMLTLTPEDGQSNIKSLFVVDGAPLSEALKREYARYVHFEEFPIKVGVQEAGVFTYGLLGQSDVEILVAPSMPNSSLIYEKTIRKAPKGVNSTPWVFGKSIEKGDYSASISFTGGNTQQPAYSLLLHAE
jgi:hypothetical protein